MTKHNFGFSHFPAIIVSALILLVFVALVVGTAAISRLDTCKHQAFEIAKAIKLAGC